MRVLVLGANGMLGHKLTQRLAGLADVRGTVRWSHVPRRLNSALNAARVYAGVEAERSDSIVHVIRSWRPRVVVNCIGIVKQLPDAKDHSVSSAVNSLFPHRLADICSAFDARLIHLSTDCVFSGIRGGYVESDRPDPVDVYGRTKLLGEVTDSNCLTLRTSMVGWQLDGSHGLLEWLASQLGMKVKGFRRSIFSGLSTTSLSDTIIGIIESGLPVEGLFHLSGTPIDKYSLLATLIKALRWPIDVIPADEPLIDRSLDSAAFRVLTGWVPPSWDEMIAGLAAERPFYEQWRTT